MSLPFDGAIFDFLLFQTEEPIIEVPRPYVPKKPPREGSPINAYKQFKFLDRSGNSYHLKKEAGVENSYGY